MSGSREHSDGRPPELAPQVRDNFAGLHVERHRHVIMDHHPLAVPLLETHRYADAVIGFLSVRPRRPDVAQAVTERDVSARRDPQIMIS